MRIIKVTIKGFEDSPLSQSREFVLDADAPTKQKGETEDAFAQRTWPLKMHVSKSGNVVIPAAALKQCIDAAAKNIGEKIVGKGNATWASLYTGGVMVLRDVELDRPAASVTRVAYRCDAKGNKGDRSSTRVTRYFPTIEPGWTGVLELMITDDRIPVDHLQRTLSKAGLAVGVGRFRPSKGGTNGMFTVENLVVVADDDKAA